MNLHATMPMTAMALVAALAAGGCSEKPQTASERKPDSKGWELSQSGSLAAGWKGGDQAAWEQQLRTRAEAQNEYPRSVQRSVPQQAAQAASAAPLAPKTP